MTGRTDSWADLGDLTSEEVARLDAAALDCGVTTLQLMEIAGWQVARCAWRHSHNRPVVVCVVAGHGNNGGDGLVASRHLASWGCEVRVVVVAGESQLHGIVLDQIEAARRCGVGVTVAAEPAVAPAVISAANLVIDAVLGTGLRSAPRPAQAAAIRAVNDSERPVLSVDVPSGLDATTGDVFDPCVRASLTCTLAGMKRGLRSSQAAGYTGALWVADIGMPAAAWKRAGLRRPPGVTAGELVHTSSASPS